MNNTDILSFQLYSLREYGGLERCLDLLASVGFRQVEPVMSHFEDAAGTRAALDSRGLAAPSGHFSLDAVTERTDWVIDAAKTIGIDQVIVPAVPTARRTHVAADWQRVSDTFEAVRPTLVNAGLTLAYHNHDWDLRPLDDGRTPLDVLFSDPAMKWQADVAWIARAGVDTHAWLDKYGDRLISCHVKDIAPPGENLDEDGWADVGHGVLNWTDLWTRCCATPARWMVVEHDQPKHFERFVRRSFAFLSNLGT